ncbi:BTAD domain-containing putative transcriptional regulator [Mycobacterium sp. E740]|uniref:BTAD domain-containing putative transcriptional regulator n=1 Tax=Mycobacterium sp. E740 TaxID=1834149 RepID=UPI000801F1B5|nr:BTAD domain-containing putative transcriptional regulator [Mycobacterium sp. E740]OBI75610.1 regulator [Mycobacterium sp. E740]
MELGVLGPLQVRQYGLPVTIPGAKPRAILTMLGLHGGSVVSADALVELLWGDAPPRTADKALQTHISALRRTLGDAVVLTQGSGWTLGTAEVDASRYTSAAQLGRSAMATGDAGQAVTRFNDALALWRGIPELPDGRRGTSEKTRWAEGHAALIEDRADALLATGRAAEIIGELEAAVADAPLRERRWGQLMLALYRAGRQGEALGAYQRARKLLADELGVDPGPDLRRLEAAIVAQDVSLEVPVSRGISAVTRAVTFLLTDIEGSTAAWEADAAAMAVALARHDEIVEQVVTSRGGRLIKTRGEGDATFSVFDRPSAAAAAAIELQQAIGQEPWALREPMRIRVALHTGEVEFRDGDYYGRAVNRAARLRSLAGGGQILCSGATAELVIDSLSDDVVLADLGMRQLRNLPRPEHVFELRLESAGDSRLSAPEAPMERPALPSLFAGTGPFVGRRPELERLLSAWQATIAAGTSAVLIAGEPGVGKTRLAGEWSRQAYGQGAVVLYGRCDEDLGAPYQPFAEGLRALVPCLGSARLRELRGVEALLALIPGLTDALPDLATPPRADPDTERYALFDAVVALLAVASANAPVVLVLDDLHWAAKPTLLLLRHVLRFGERARVQIVGTYRSTDLDRSHPLAAMLADLHRDGTASRLQLNGLGEDDVSAYVAEAGYDDEELARALTSVTGGNPFFLIEALRHVAESGGKWNASTLPQGVREAVSRRLSRLSTETNKALAAAAVAGSDFALTLVEQVVGDDLVDAFDEASKAGIVVEEPGGRYRFNHALVRQSLLAELASVRRMRLHQRIASTLETLPSAGDELLAELAYHYFECAWAGNAAKAVDYCRRAAEQAMARLAYEGAADLFDRALHALEELDDELPDRDDVQAELLVARCEALLAAGDVVTASDAVTQLRSAAADSGLLSAWGTCFDGQLSMLTEPERLDEIESAVDAAAREFAAAGDAAGEAKAHTVRAGCLARLGRIGDCEAALDQALTAARQAHEHRRVNAVLANAPLAALWGPNPVPRAGGRCLDVVRLLRITTGSPVVEATSTRCQAVLDAFRGRAAEGRRLIESARRTLTELGLRHALLEVDQFAGIVELVADEPTAAEPYLRRAYDGFRRMGLDADTADTAALLARVCLALDRDTEADELCRESQRLAGHALKASIAWRAVRAQLLARDGEHDEARRIAEEAVALAERTDGLIDHGDACLALAAVLSVAGDAGGARTAAERALSLYEAKGAAALADKARSLLGERGLPTLPTPLEEPAVGLDNDCARAIRGLEYAYQRDAWDECSQFFAPNISVESRRKVVGFTRASLEPGDWPRVARHLREGWSRLRNPVVAVRGQRLALTRMQLDTDDASPGAPHEEFLGLWGLDEDGRIALQMFFDIEDIHAATAELDALHAQLEPPHPRPLLENAAIRAEATFNALCASKRWGEFGSAVADDILVDDRRKGLHTEFRGRDTLLAESQAIGGLGTASVISDAIAARGERLALFRTVFLGQDTRPDAYRTEMLRIVEVDADQQIATIVVFELDEFDAAIAELDARYLAGEAAPHAQTWSAVTRIFEKLNSRELPPTTPDWVGVDRRRLSTIEAGDMGAYLRATWEATPNGAIFIQAVHQLSAAGAVITYTAHGTQQEFDAEWQYIIVVTFDGDLISRCETFDEEDLEAALAEFGRLSGTAPRLQNVASRVVERFWARYAARDMKAVAEMLASTVSSDDRRRVVNAGIRDDPGAVVKDLLTGADWIFDVTTTVTATRGERLVLSRTRFSGGDRITEAFAIEVLLIIEINFEERIQTFVTFDVDAFDGAVGELDARYAAGEAAGFARTWSAMFATYDAFNQGQLPATTSDWVNLDHRHVTTMAPGDLIANLTATWAVLSDAKIYIESVHRLTDLGGVLTHVITGTSQESFNAEWRMVNLLTVDGDLISRCEMFDEADLDTALARFDELNRPTKRLENAASGVYDRVKECFAARAWDTMADLFADDICSEDRRRVVNTGVSHGRDALIAEISAIAEVAVTQLESDVIATRGERLVLSRVRVSETDQRSDAFSADSLDVIEVGPDGRAVARIVFDADDIDAAFTELDARYLAGEAAAHAGAWSAVTRNALAFNQRESLITTPDWISVDHRRATAFETGDMTQYIHATWDVAPDISLRIEAVNQLNDIGAVFTQVLKGTSHEGFDAEWRDVIILTVDGDRLNRCEIFDEAELDAALTRFEELSASTPELQNAAYQVYERFWSCFAARDWDSMARGLTDGYRGDDRRRVVNAGVRNGPDAEITNVRAIADVGAAPRTINTIATRGQRLVLTRELWSVPDGTGKPFQNHLLEIIETDETQRMTAAVTFSLDDLDTAFEELDTRYAAGEAAPYAHVWSVIAGVYAAFNRHELAPTNWVGIDHRRGTPFASSDLNEFVRGVRDFTPDLSIYVERVHRLNEFGAVVTNTSCGSSPDGFDVEWRTVEVLMVDGNRIHRLELFDETDLDTALARFDELCCSATRPENSATRVYDTFEAHFLARNWDAIADMLSADHCNDDRRAVTGAGLRHGPKTVMADLRTVAVTFGVMEITRAVIAIRGERLALLRTRYSGRDDRPGAYFIDALVVVELDADEKVLAFVLFDAHDTNAAFAELEDRYLAGEASGSAQTWSVIAQGYAAASRGELAATAAHVTNIDHRKLPMIASGGLIPYLRSTFDELTNIRTYPEAVHRLTDGGAVITHVGSGTSKEGFHAEWRLINLLVVVDGVVSRTEVFDETDLDSALAHFDQLCRRLPKQRPSNTASRVTDRFCECFGARDWKGTGDTLADNVCTDDNRPVVGVGRRQGRDLNVADWQAVARVGTRNLASTVVATRATRLALSRFVTSGRDQRPEAFRTEVLCVVEIDGENQISACVMFEPHEVDAAFAELEARYLAGEAAQHAQVWSDFADAYAMFNRHEIPPLSNWVTVDHRVRETFAGDELAAYLRSGWDVAPDNKMYIECVHRLSDLGAVITYTASGTSPEGFFAEWRMIALLAVEGASRRCELFEEADLETALGAFDELSRPAPRLENTATRIHARAVEAFNRRDERGFNVLVSTGARFEDHRSGLRDDRLITPEFTHVWFTEAPPSWHLTTEAVAVRGSRLMLSRDRYRDKNEQSQPITVEYLALAEVTDDGLISYAATFDFADADAAFVELDRRYLAGEASENSRTWSAILQAYAAFNRHEAPTTTPDWVDHRLMATIEAGDLIANIHAAWDLVPDVKVHISAVHRLNGLGAVIDVVVKGSSQEGFYAEYRETAVVTVAGDVTNRFEMFDERDLDAALVRFDELNSTSFELNNAAIRARAEIADAYNRRDLELLTPSAESRYDDRRKGLRDQGIADRNYAIALLSETPTSWQLQIEPIAIRGDRLALTREKFRDTAEASLPVTVELVALTEVTVDGIVSHTVFFDPTEADAAVAELDARWMILGPSDG